MTETPGIPVEHPPGLRLRYQAVPLDGDVCALTLVNDSPAGIRVTAYRGPTLWAGWNLNPSETIVSDSAPAFDRLRCAWLDGYGPDVRRGLCRFQHERAETP